MKHSNLRSATARSRCYGWTRRMIGRAAARTDIARRDARLLNILFIYLSSVSHMSVMSLVVFTQLFWCKSSFLTLEAGVSMPRTSIQSLCSSIFGHGHCCRSNQQMVNNFDSGLLKWTALSEQRNETMELDRGILLVSYPARGYETLLGRVEVSPTLITHTSVCMYVAIRRPRVHHAVCIWHMRVRI